MQAAGSKIKPIPEDEDFAVLRGRAGEDADRAFAITIQHEELANHLGQNAAQRAAR